MSQQGSPRPVDGGDGDPGAKPESHDEDDRARTTQASDSLRTALQAWREDVQGVSQIGADLQGELASLRRDLFFDEVPPAAASERLERAGGRLAGQLERLRKGEATAAEAVRAVLRTLSDAKDQLNKERAVAAVAPPSVVTDRVRLTEEAMLSALGNLKESVELRLSALDRRIGANVLEAPSSEALTELVAVVRDGLDTVNRSVKEWPDGLARIGPMVGGVRAQLDAVREEIPRSVAEQVKAVERRMAEAVAEVRKEQRTVSERVERSGEVIQKGMDEVLATVAEAVDALRADLAKHAEGLEAGLTRVGRLGDAVEDIGRRRGFRKLADAERAVLSEQTSLVERLEASGDSVASFVREAQGRIEEAARVAASIAEESGRDASAVAEMSDAVQALPRAFDARLAQALAATRTDLEELVATEVQRLAGSFGTDQLAEELSALRGEVEGLRAAIEGWARPRTAPKLSQQVRALDRKFQQLEASVEQTLAKEVAARVRASIDRRLKAFLESVREAE